MKTKRLHYAFAALVMILSAIPDVSAQTYVNKFTFQSLSSFVTEGKMWHCSKWKPAFTGLEDRYYYIQGDTVINGRAAKKMYLKFSKEGTTGNYQAALYEEGSKVYSCYNGSDTFSLLYDFGLNVGEEVTIHNETYTVEMVEECVVKDTPLRVIHLRYDESEESSYQFTWVQGFGGTSEPLYSGPSLPGNNESFQACEMGGEVVLTREQIPSRCLSYIIPFDGKKWTIETMGVYPGALKTTHSMWIEGDTIVGDKACKKLHILSQSEDGKESYTIECCRQDGEKFYRGEKLLFDFGLQQGDLFQASENVVYTVTQVGDTILSDGVSRRCLTINPFNNGVVDESISDLWIEGVGSLEMGIYGNIFDTSGLYRKLLSCTYNNTVIYKESSNKIETSGTTMAKCRILALGSSLTFTSPTATRVELYTPDAVKVGEATFAGGEAVLEAPHTPAAYLYIVTYPDGHRESGKVMVK
ncbi:MAG: hypothetical protein IJ467_05300 [Bacteroidaceae bacterium]|nr:hypothetical protein [Bacteroidaceae bacterium]